MTVYVVIKYEYETYPQAVFAKRESAEAFVRSQKEPTSWAVMEFEVRAE